MAHLGKLQELGTQDLLGTYLPKVFALALDLGKYFQKPLWGVTAGLWRQEPQRLW